MMLVTAIETLRLPPDAGAAVTRCASDFPPRIDFGPSITAPIKTASVTIDPNAIYNPRRLRGAASGTNQGEAAVVAAVNGAVGGNGKGGGIMAGIGTATGDIVRVGDTASGNACPSAPRNASAV